MKHIERGPATRVAHTRENLTLSTPCLFLVILTAALFAEGRAACRLRDFCPGTGQKCRIVPADGRLVKVIRDGCYKQSPLAKTLDNARLMGVVKSARQ